MSPAATGALLKDRRGPGTWIGAFTLIDGLGRADHRVCDVSSGVHILHTTRRPGSRRCNSELFPCFSGAGATIRGYVLPSAPVIANRACGSSAYPQRGRAGAVVMTTAPAPTTLWSPIRTPMFTIAPAPMKTWSPMVTGAARRPGRRGRTRTGGPTSGCRCARPLEMSQPAPMVSPPEPSIMREGADPRARPDDGVADDPGVRVVRVGRQGRLVVRDVRAGHARQTISVSTSSFMPVARRWSAPSRAPRGPG